MASFFLSLKNPGNNPRVWWLSASPGGRLGLWLWLGLQSNQGESGKCTSPVCFSVQLVGA